MISLDLNQILDYLTKKKYNAHFQKETNQICVIFKIEQKEFPLFIRISENNDLLQMITFIPRTMKASSVSEVARLLHLFNKELDLPGFGMNEESGHIFYRCIIPCTKKKLESSVLEGYLNSIQIVCKSFSPPIEALAEGAISYEALVKMAKEREQKNSKT